MPFHVKPNRSFSSSSSFTTVVTPRSTPTTITSATPTTTPTTTLATSNPSSLPPQSVTPSATSTTSEILTSFLQIYYTCVLILLNIPQQWNLSLKYLTSQEIFYCFGCCVCLTVCFSYWYLSLCFAKVIKSLYFCSDVE